VGEEIEDDAQGEHRQEAFARFCPEFLLRIRKSSPPLDASADPPRSRLGARAGLGANEKLGSNFVVLNLLFSAGAILRVSIHLRHMSNVMLTGCVGLEVIVLYRGDLRVDKGGRHRVAR
jgi:hypothetical protein